MADVTLPRNQSTAERLLCAALILSLLLIVTLSATAAPPGPPEPASLAGWFTIVWGDPVRGAEAGSDTRYVLAMDDGARVVLVLDEAAATPWGGVLALNRQRVRVEGTWVAAAGGDLPALEVASIRPEAAPEAGQVEDVIGSQPWISIMCKFADVPAEPRDLAYFEGMYGSSYPGMDHYWREQSFDLVNVLGSGAVGWYTLPHPREYYVYDQNGDGVPDLDHTRAANDCTGVADPDVYYPDFVGINLMFNDVLDCCAWGGSWYMFRDGVGKVYRMTWEPPWGYNNVGVIAHEMGHGFGLPHSSGTYGQTYDNRWDVMSDVWTGCPTHPVYGCLGQHTISYHKDILGWVDAGQRYVVTPGSRPTITLEQLALPATGNYLLVQVPLDTYGQRFYTAEVRRQVGYDTKLPGQAVIIHEVDTNRTIPAHVIDADGNGNTGDAGAMWLPGESFVDPAAGISISVLSATATGYVIRVDTPAVALTGVEVTGPATGDVGQPTAFTATATPAGASQPVTYTWQATGQAPVVHVGDLDDTAVFTWYTSGPKTVVVTATNRANAVTDSAAISIQGPPVAGFHSSTPDWLGQTTAFSNTTSGLGPIAYTWDLGDGMHSQAVNPTHAYGAPGIYTVWLTATNASGSDVASDTVTVYSAPTVDLSAAPLEGLRPLTVAFTSTATTVPPGDPTLSYAWQFGDGATSNAPHPTHVYTAAGSYTVTLAVGNAAGSHTITRTRYVRVYEPVWADFSGWPTAGEAPLVVSFANTSGGDYQTSLWDFGDGLTSTVTSPLHVYTAGGAFTVTLSVAGPGGTDTLARPRYISVTVPTTPGLTILGHVWLHKLEGEGLTGVKIYRRFASYPGVVVAETDADGYYQSAFQYIPGDEMVTVWAEADGYVFEPEEYDWRHYYGYEVKRLDFVARPEHQLYLPLVVRGSEG